MDRGPIYFWIADRSAGRPAVLEDSKRIFDRHKTRLDDRVVHIAARVSRVAARVSRVAARVSHVAARVSHVAVSRDSTGYSSVLRESQCSILVTCLFSQRDRPQPMHTYSDVAKGRFMWKHIIVFNVLVVELID